MKHTKAARNRMRLAGAVWWRNQHIWIIDSARAGWFGEPRMLYLDSPGGWVELGGSMADEAKKYWADHCEEQGVVAK